MSASQVDDITVRPIRADEPEAFRELRLEALRRHPTAFTAGLTEAEERQPDAWRDEVARSLGDAANVIMFADAAGRGLAGMAGV
jgi:hypothetical protein